MMLFRLPFAVSLFLDCVHFISAGSRPNFVVIFADDVGYGDFQSYGHPTQEKGPIDEMAAEGMRFTQWYSAASLCTPSRAALLTGRYPIRSGIVGPARVFHVGDHGGLPKNETTIAEALKSYGYATGIVGKWHLGINEFEANDFNHLPHHHGFDNVGTILPFTFHWNCNPQKFPVEKMSKKCFLYRGTGLVQQPIEVTTLTEKIRSDSIEFIQEHQRESFFLYMALPHTHSAVFCSPMFCNKSRRGLYGDNVNEMAWAVSCVLETLKDLHIDNNTLVLFLSDHGPQIEMCYEGGSSGLLKGGKASTWDGGIRVPAIAWWPGTVPGGMVSHEVVSSLDIFPTLLGLAGGKPTTFFDGVSITDVLMGRRDDSSNKPVHDILFHYCSDKIMAVRGGRYKLHYHTQVPEPEELVQCIHGKPLGDFIDYLNCNSSIAHDPPLIFDMNVDPGEVYPLDPLLHEDLIKEAAEKVEEHKKTLILVPSQLNRSSPLLMTCCNPPLCHCNYNISASSRKDEL